MDSDEEDESYIIRAEREAKQQYLREEILELDYDPQLFMAYCESIREANIDAWDFEELQDCVLNFKKLYRPGQLLSEVKGIRKFGSDEFSEKKEENFGEKTGKNSIETKENIKEIYELKEEKRTIENIEKSNKKTEADEAFNETSVISEEENKVFLKENQPEHDEFLFTNLNPQKVSEKDKLSEENDSALVDTLKEPEDTTPIQEKLTQNDVEIEKISQICVLACAKIPETQLSLQCDLNVQITEVTTVNDGVFSKNYTIYEVFTPHFQ